VREGWEAAEHARISYPGRGPSLLAESGAVLDNVQAPSDEDVRPDHLVRLPRSGKRLQDQALLEQAGRLITLIGARILSNETRNLSLLAKNPTGRHPADGAG